MRSRNVILTLVIFLLIFLFAVLRNWQEPQPNEAFNRTPARLRFYAFARCRMRCLHVSDADIRALMKSGVINLGRSNRYGHPCPIFAVQGRTAGRRYIRAVFEQCHNATYLANCYNIEQDITCDCTTDYKPNGN